MLLNDQHRSVHIFDEPLSDGRIQKGEQHIEVAFHIQKATGLFMDSELSPSNDLEEFLQGAEPARHGNESISKVSHDGFSFMHRFRHSQIRQPLEGDFFFDQRLGNNSYDFAARTLNGICQFAHQTHVGSAIHKTDTSGRKRVAQMSGRYPVFWPGPGTRPARYT